MVAWKRFPVPEFDADPFKDMTYEAPAPITPAEAAALGEKAASGDASAIGGHVVMPDEALFEKYDIKGDHRHAVFCALPSNAVQLLGRSWAWPIQRALILDSLDAASANVLYDWRTPRPMNTRLGPEDGVSVTGSCVVITGNKYADHWISNRTIVENDWQPEDASNGFRILSGSDDELDDFHDSYLAFTWSA